MFLDGSRKVRVVPCSTVWLCQCGARAPLRRRPSVAEWTKMLKSWASSQEDCPPHPASSVLQDGREQHAAQRRVGILASPSALASCLQRDCRCCCSRARKRCFMARVLVSSRNPASSICGKIIGVVIGLIRVVGGWTGIIRHVCRTRLTTHRGGHQLPPRDTPATRANECILEVVLRC